MVADLRTYQFVQRVLYKIVSKVLANRLFKQLLTEMGLLLQRRVTLSLLDWFLMTYSLRMR
jgi:hypothetical protein